MSMEHITNTLMLFFPLLHAVVHHQKVCLPRNSLFLYSTTVDQPILDAREPRLLLSLLWVFIVIIIINKPSLT